jgi:hypothetical protein
MTAITVLLLGFMYRLRGGGFVTIGSTTVCRLIWGVSLSLVMFTDWWSLFVIPLAFLSMLIPHGYAQNMGGWATPQNRWPTFFLPTWTQLEWDTMSPALRTFNDFIQMFFIGAWRGWIVFGGLTLVKEFATIGEHAMWQTFIAAWATGLFQALGYLLGKYFPLSIGSSLPAKSACWGEFFNGVGWALSVAIYLGW